MQFVIGTTTVSAAKFGLASLPPQLLIDAGDSSAQAGTLTIPYAWVQVQINGVWTVMDPSAKTYTVLPGTSLARFQPAPPAMTNTAIQSYLSSFAQNIYNANKQNYAAMAAFIGGRRPQSSVYTNPNNLPTASTGGAPGGSAPVAYNYMPWNYRTLLGVTLQNGAKGNVCTDQVYGHDVVLSSSNFMVDGVVVYAGSQSPNPASDTFTITHQIWKAGALTYPWSQTAAESVYNWDTVHIELGIGRIGSSRPRHDSDLATRTDPHGGSGSSFFARSIGTSQLSQTSHTTEMLDQLAGTYTLNHHMVQFIRCSFCGPSSMSIDTPMTSTSVDTVNAHPASGLTVSPNAVAYALSALQSAEEAAALVTANATQSESAATMMGWRPDPTHLIHVA